MSMPRSRRWSRFRDGIHLILGGKDKGSDYSVLNPLLKERVKRVYTIGAAAAKIEAQASRHRDRKRRNAGSSRQARQ